MRIQRLAIGIVAAMVVTAPVLAAADARPGRKPLRKMSCSDFLLMDDAAKPEIVYWAATYSQGGKPGSAFLDVDDSDRMVPSVIEKCKGAPAEPFWAMVKAEARKVEKKL